MNGVVSALLGMGVNFLQTPQGQQLLTSLLPTLVGGAKGLLANLAASRDAGSDVEAQKAALVKLIVGKVQEAAAKAEADHKAHPDSDDAFDPGVFRD